MKLGVGWGKVWTDREKIMKRGGGSKQAADSWENKIQNQRANALGTWTVGGKGKEWWCRHSANCKPQAWRAWGGMLP